MRELDCAYCGIKKSSKKGDHIPPQSIYAKPRKPNLKLFSVPSCIECNNSASKDDEVFKVIIGLDTAELRNKSVISSINKTFVHNDRIAAEVFNKAKKMYIDKGKKILEPVVRVEIETTAYNNVVSRMVRGLFWKETGQIMHTDSSIYVEPESNGDLNRIVAICSVLKAVSPKYLNDSTFLYKFYIGDDGSTIWGMKFFDKHSVFVYSEANEHNVMSY